MKENDKGIIQVRNILLGGGQTKICVSVTEQKDIDIINKCREIKEAGADLVEWRIDWYDSFSEEMAVKELLPKMREQLEDIPLILTFRTRQEGGNAQVGLEDYLKIYQWAAATDCIDIFDIEMWIYKEVTREAVDKIKGKKAVILSKHDFSKTPSKQEIIDTLMEMQEIGGDIAKIALMPNSREDVETLMEASMYVKEKSPRTPIITISMGELGRDSRIQGKKTGSCLTFATVGKASAPGQISIQELKNLMK